MSLGEARNLAEEMIELNASGGDVKSELGRRSGKDIKTDFATLTMRFCHEYTDQKSDKHAVETRRIFKTYFQRFHDQDIRKIDPHDLVALIQDMAKEHPYQANRCHATVSRFYRWCANQPDLRRIGLTSNPLSVYDKPALIESRDRQFSHVLA